MVRCETASYYEWSPQEFLEFSLAADEPESIRPVWRAYPQVRQYDPLPCEAPHGAPLPNYEWVGQPLMISDFLSDREFRGGGLYAELCKPLGVRAVLKVFLPTGGVLVFDTTRSRFTETDRLAVQRIVPHLAQLRRNAHARRTYPAPIDTTAAARTNLLRLTPRERVVLARAAAGETNTAIAQELFVSPGTVRKHLEHIYDKLEVRTRTQAAAIYTDDHLPACLGQSPANDPHRGRASLAPRQAPYDLRHACLSTWLNGGVYPTQVAEWAGHGVDVLLRIYAKRVVGQDELAKRRISEALCQE